jgi:hypothetical protein
MRQDRVKRKEGTYTLAVWTVRTVLHVEVRVHAVLCPAVFPGDLAGDDVVAAAMMGAFTVKNDELNEYRFCGGLTCGDDTL